jgi:hypothetical protein
MTGKTFFMDWRRPASRSRIEAQHDSWPICLIGIEFLHVCNAEKLVTFGPFRKFIRNSNVDIGISSKKLFQIVSYFPEVFF